MLDVPKSVDGRGWLRGLYCRRFSFRDSASSCVCCGGAGGSRSRQQYGALIEGMPASLQTAITKAVKGLPTG